MKTLHRLKNEVAAYFCSGCERIFKLTPASLGFRVTKGKYFDGFYCGDCAVGLLLHISLTPSGEEN